jgi:hypothetical protein
MRFTVTAVFVGLDFVLFFVFMITPPFLYEMDFAEKFMQESLCTLCCEKILWLCALRGKINHKGHEDFTKDTRY